MHPKPKHITQQLEAYVDDQLSPQERRRVEEHAANCPDCARRLFDAHRISTELKPVLKTKLGQPHPPTGLRRQTKAALEARSSRRWAMPWIISGRLLDAVGTVAVIALLAIGVFTVIQGQLPGADGPVEIQLLRPNLGGGDVPAVTTPTPLAEIPPTATPIPAVALSSLGDTLPSSARLSEKIPATSPDSQTNIPFSDGWSRQDIEPSSPSGLAVDPTPPEGRIAFSFFNAAGNRQVYETHLIRPDGSDHTIFPLDGVSEPALSPDGQHLAYRAWSRPTSPRSLLSSNLEGYTPFRVGGFWEDALPDWSPTEYRLIYSSQRESDRKWRLYSSSGDGSEEINLRREGRNPTFAPDGYRFAFESCDRTSNRCGLWQGDLDNAEYESYPFLEDPLAQAPDWSPTGETIAYMANPDGNWDLYLVESDGSRVRRLTFGPTIEGLPVWSPDGDWLAFLSDRGGVWGIWRLHVDSGQTEQVVSLPDVTFRPPRQDPYGERSWLDEQLSWSY